MNEQKKNRKTPSMENLPEWMGSLHRELEESLTLPEEEIDGLIKGLDMGRIQEEALNKVYREMDPKVDRGEDCVQRHRSETNRTHCRRPHTLLGGYYICRNARVF